MRLALILTLAAGALATPALAEPGRPGLHLAQAGCPPGLAKKNPPCIPPGQARRQGYRVGDYYDGDWRPIDRDRYGLPPLRRGEAYVRVGDSILRLDRSERIILDIVDLVLN